jgi:hypothetical protein
MIVGLYTVLVSIVYVITAFLQIYCSSVAKGKEVIESTYASTSQEGIPFVKGNMDYYKAKLHKHMTFHEIAATAEDFQKMNSNIDNSKAGTNLGSVVRHFRSKSKKHIAIIQDLANGNKRQGLKNLDYLKKKGKIPANYRPTP